MITIETAFDMKSIHDFMEKKADEQMNRVVDYLRKKGIEYTTGARRKSYAKEPYNNITFNLVSSVGFSIARKKAIVESYFPLWGGGTEGQAKGKALAERVSLEECGADDIVLILVAGEDYARFVQAKGKDVVAGASDAFTAFLNQIWGAYK